MTDPYTPTTENEALWDVLGDLFNRLYIQDENEPSLVEAAADYLRPILAAHDAQVREESLNAGVVLAALDGMLEPWTLQKDAEISSMKYRIRRLRDQVAQYVPALPVPSTGTEEVEPKFEIPGFEGTNELLAKLTIRTEGEN